MAKYASFKRRGKKDTAPNAKTRRHNLRTGRDESHYLPKEMRLANYHLNPIPNGEINDTIEREKRESEERYQKENNRKLRSDAHRTESALLILSEEQVANCNPDEIWKKCIEFKEWFEKEFNTKIHSMDWHRDEGKVNKKGELISRNNHVHIEYDNVDKEGRMVRKKFSKGTMYKFQDKTAEIFKPLGFIRGEDSRKDPNYVVKRGLSIKEYRLKMKKEDAIKEKLDEENQQKLSLRVIAQSKDLNEKNKELKEEQKKIRTSLQELQAERPVYALLEQKNTEIRKSVSELEKQVKSKDLTITELDANFKNIEEKYTDIKAELADALALNRQFEKLLSELQQKPEMSKEDTITSINKDTNTKYLLDHLEAKNYIDMQYFGSDAKGKKLECLVNNEEWEEVGTWELLTDILEINKEEALSIAIACRHDDVREKQVNEIKAKL